jgi:hypothetical protein
MKKTPLKRNKPISKSKPAATPEKAKIPKTSSGKPKPVKRSTLENKADVLARAYCKSIGYCEAHGAHGIRCSERLEWAHCKSRAKDYIKHDPLNCFCLCWSHHKFFTEHPDHWYKWVETARPGTWDRLNALLIEQRNGLLKADYEYWIDFYTRNPKRPEAA